MRNKNKNRFAHLTCHRLSDAARRSAEACVQVARHQGSPWRSDKHLLSHVSHWRYAAPATFNVLPQEGQVLGRQHDRCLSHGGGHFVLGHLKGRSHDWHFVMKGPFVHNKAFFCLKKRILNYYSLSLTTQCVTHCPKEHKRKQMKECYSRETDTERGRELQQLLNYLHRKVAWGHFFRFLDLGDGHVCHLPNSTKVCKHQQADAIIPSFEGVGGNHIFKGCPQLRQADFRKVHCVFYIYTRHQGRLCTAFCIDMDIVICKIIFERIVLIAQHVKNHRTRTYTHTP